MPSTKNKCYKQSDKYLPADQLEISKKAKLRVSGRDIVISGWNASVFSCLEPPQKFLVDYYIAWDLPHAVNEIFQYKKSYIQVFEKSRNLYSETLWGKTGYFEWCRKTTRKERPAKSVQPRARKNYQVWIIRFLQNAGWYWYNIQEMGHIQCVDVWT